MKAEDVAGGSHAPEDDRRSRAELLAIIQRQERELAVLASMVTAKNNVTVVTETPAPEPEPQVVETPSEQQIASYKSLGRQLALLGRSDTARALRRLRLLK